MPVQKAYQAEVHVGTGPQSSTVPLLLCRKKEWFNVSLHHKYLFQLNSNTIGSRYHQWKTFGTLELEETSQKSQMIFSLADLHQPAHLLFSRELLL